MDAEAIIDRLGLQAHPEGGYFKEVYRSEIKVHSSQADSERSAVTDIYFLLKEGEVSRFHKVLHDEIWHFYSGAPLKLLDADLNELREVFLGGADTFNFKHTIKAGRWQAAETTGRYSLLGCTVAPGFDFSDFSFLNDEPEALQLFEKKFLNYRDFF